MGRRSHEPGLDPALRLGGLSGDPEEVTKAARLARASGFCRLSSAVGQWFSDTLTPTGGLHGR
jgi:hypothetical protein